MKKIILLFLYCLPLFNIYSQVTFTQSTTNDFLNGMVNNVQVINNSVVVPSRMVSNQDWTTAPNLPANLSQHQTIVWRSYVYLVGGFDGSNISGAVYNANILSSGNAGWVTQNSLPVGIKNAAVVATPTRLYVLGGYTNSGPTNLIYFATLNDDGSIGTWSLANITLPQALQGHKAQYINGYVYIIGGTNQTNDSSALNNVYFAKVNLDGSIGNFTATTSLPEARNGHSMVNYDNNIYIIGGYDNSNTKQRTVYYSNINNDGTCSSWQSANQLPYSISNHSSTCSQGIITVIGGEDSILVSNKFLYANIDASPSLTWVLSPNYLYDRSMNGSVYEAPGQIVYSGGTNLSGNPISSNRYVLFNLDTNKVKRSSFVSNPFVIGTPKNIQQLAYNLTYNSATDSVELYYRLAGPDTNWSSWIPGGIANPVIINQSQSYIQYMLRFFSNSASTLSFNSLTLTVSGFTELCGDLNSIDTLRAINSPYWAICDVSFTNGTHVIQSGVKIEFLTNTSMEIGNANVMFNGTLSNPIILTSDDTLKTHWNGLYFDPNSNSGFSNLSYTNISYAGNSSYNADIYCNSTNGVTIDNCIFRNSSGQGIRLDYSNPNIANTIITNNAINGLSMNASSPDLISVNTNNNGFAGLFYASNGLNPIYANCISANNLYGIYSPTPDNSFAPPSSSTVVLNNNNTDIAVGGGNINTSRTWSYFPNGIALLGDVSVFDNGSSVRLTIAPGLTVKVANNSGIYIGGNSTTGGEIYANGNPDSLITFTSLNDSIGGWNGFNFNDGSDYGSTSSFRYCIIEKGNDHNIYSYYSNEPHIQFSTIRNSVNYGIRSEYSNLSIEQSIIKTASIGIYLNNADPSMVYNTIDSISNFGIYYADHNSLPTFFLDTIENSQFGIYYPDPDFDFPTLPNITFLNLKGSIAIDGGTISTNETWSFNTYPYAILNNIIVAKPNDTCRLTIKPGCTLKFANNAQLEIAYQYSWYDSRGGELYADGTLDSMIIFSSLNDSIGGWNGLYFNMNSSAFGSTSSLKYCTIEKASQYNIWCDQTNQPIIDSCSFNNSANMGIYATTSPIIITNSIINNNGGIGINANNSLLNLSNLTINNNVSYGLYYNDAYYLDNLINLQFNGNMNDGVVIAGGTISDNRLWNYLQGKPYTILGNILVAKPNDTCRLTIKPGCTLKFANNAQLQIAYQYSWYDSRGGELYADGTLDSMIIFSSLNDSIGGWNGLYFNMNSSAFGSTSSLKYCTIEKASQYNIWCDQTNQPIIANCSFNNSANMGIYATTSPITITNSVIDNNGGIGINANNSLLNLSNLTINNNVSYGLYYNDAYYLDSLINLQFNGNMNDGVVIAGGTISDNRLWNYLQGKPYTILGNILVAKPNDTCRLTIKPGCTLKFANNTQLQIGYQYSWYDSRGGELYAEGTLDSMIIFSPLNDSIGGWNGLYFSTNSSAFGSTSSLKYCKIEKGYQFNIYCNNTSQPTINKTIIEKSSGYGLWLDAATNIVRNTKIVNNNGYGVYLTNGSNPTIGNDMNSTCDIYNNYLYNVYNNSTVSFNMSYNFLGSMDSSYIETRNIYDYIENNSLGRISFMPISELPSQFNKATVFTGNLLYDNNLNKPIENATLKVKDYLNNILITTQTNSDGSYNLNPDLINVSNKIEIDPLDLFGGVNATDALMVLLDFTHQITLVGHHSFVADVNNSKTINGTDALFILKRFVGQINSFPTGDLLINCDSTLLTTDTINYYMSMLWFGDVNASYTPLSDKSEDMNLVYDGSIQSYTNDEFTIPVKVKDNLNNVGAISLVFEFPDNLIEITGVTLKSNNEDMLFSSNNGILQTGWYSLDAINLNNGEDFLIIKAKLKSTDFNEPIAFELNAKSEFSDAWANKIDNITLSMPKINSIQAISNNKPILEPNFPNPVNGETEFIYNVEEQAMVNLSVYDVLGQKVAELVNTNIMPGRYTVKYNTDDLKKGVYIYRITMKTTTDLITSERKMIVE